MNDKRLIFLISYLCLILYGSLIPFKFSSLSWADALDAFSQIPFLHLGMMSRADLVANGILYFPLGAFWGTVRIGKLKSLQTLVLGVLFSCLFAIFVEFLQLFFSVRTVSLNDIAAEMIGSVLGGVVFYVFNSKVIKLWSDFHSGLNSSIKALLVFYSIFVFLYSFFPYDFVISYNELINKFSSERVVAGVIGNSFNVGVILHLFAEFLFVLPLGVVTYRIFSSRVSNILYPLLFSGLFIGIALEGGQIFLVSGSTQAVSVVVKFLGVVAGGLVYQFYCRHDLSCFSRLIPLCWWLGIPIYLTLVFFSKGLQGHWLSFSDGIGRLDYKMLMPFYFHYYSNESVAFVSCFLNLILYGILGGIGAVRHWYASGLAHTARMWIFTAMTLSLFVEIGRLFVADRVPDFTNVLLAGIGSWFAFYFINFLVKLPWFIEGDNS